MPSSLRRTAKTVPTSRAVVMESVPQLRPTTNPYLHQLVATVAQHDDVVLFSWRRALLGRYDLFHVHWPELLSRGSSRGKTRVKRLLTRAMQLRVRAQRIPVVRTVHNVAPHEQGSRAEQRILARWDALTTEWITLNAHSPLPPGTPPAHLIPHGDYRDYYASHPASPPRPRAVASVGQIRGYKGTDSLLTAFAGLDDAEARLVIAGACPDARLAAEVRDRAAADARITADLRFLDDATLVQRITEASLVALPYAAMHNSGALLLALSLERPVLAPRNPITEELAQEVGDGWLHLFDDIVDAADLATALDRGIPTQLPDLSARAWPDAGEAHAHVFDAAMTRHNRRRSR
ncbi:glycosyltransferase [Microbacterium sp.]|uniref:glycosyltransferase n=1 Tax=Microbacterium sp. TaxID=51671 RepID=UPI003A85AA16